MMQIFSCQQKFPLSYAFILMARKSSIKDNRRCFQTKVKKDKKWDILKKVYI